jgi:hypothetical protein
MFPQDRVESLVTAAKAGAPAGSYNSHNKATHCGCCQHADPTRPTPKRQQLTSTARSIDWINFSISVMLWSILFLTQGHKAAPAQQAEPVVRHRSRPCQHLRDSAGPLKKKGCDNSQPHVTPDAAPTTATHASAVRQHRKRETLPPRTAHLITARSSVTCLAFGAIV